MTTTETTAVGVFDDLAQAEQSLDELRRAGFSSEEIGIIGHVDAGKQSAVPTPTSLKPPEDNAIQGVLGGALMGALIGGLVILVIPGIGWISGQGRWFEILGGIILGAAVGGPLFAFGSMFFSRARARRYARELDRGRFIVTVSNPQRRDEAVSLLRRQAVHAERAAG
jgi:hypothetical protein